MTEGCTEWVGSADGADVGLIEGAIDVVGAREMVGAADGCDELGCAEGDREGGIVGTGDTVGRDDSSSCCRL